jgi:hypothetical protein
MFAGLDLCPEERMKSDRGSGLFAGLSGVVEQSLGVSKFASKSAASELARNGIGTEAATLVPALFALLDQNWARALQGATSHSRQNFRWWLPQTSLADGNLSPEVSLERELIRAIVAAKRSDWSNQVPLISGIAGPHAFKKRAVDLVHRLDDGCFEFVELKVCSDTPMFAAIESLVYGLLWLLSRRDRSRLGYTESAILDAQSLRLSVLAPQIYYSGYSLTALADVIDIGLRDLGRHHDVDMDFRFTAFPSAFYWSSDRSDPKRPCDQELIALLDGRGVF